MVGTPPVLRPNFPIVGSYIRGDGDGTRGRCAQASIWQSVIYALRIPSVCD